MEGCLMEEKMAWRRVNAELVENHRLAQDMSATLAEFRACHAELLCCLSAEEKSITGGQGGGHTGVQGEVWQLLHFTFYCYQAERTLLLLLAVKGLSCVSTVELKKKLDSNEEELGKLVSSELKPVSSMMSNIDLSGVFFVLLVFHVTVRKLQTVLQSLRRLSALEKVSDNWERP